VTAAELPIIAALAPVLLFPTPRRLPALAVLPVVWFCARIATGRAIPRTPLNAALAVLMAMVGVSLYVTFDVRHSLGKVCGVVLGVLLFLAIVRWVITPARLRLATAAFVLTGAALALVGMLSVQGTGKVAELGQVVEDSPLAIRGLPGAEEGVNPNPVAGCLVLFVPLQIALLVRRRRTAALILGQCALLAVTLTALFLMQSRAAWGGLVFAPLAILVLSNRIGRMFVAIGAIAGVMPLLILGPQQLVDLVINRMMSYSLGIRVELWWRALLVIREHPFVGVGMNVFRKLVGPLPPQYRQDYRVDMAHAHNHFLQAAVDVGIPGLVAYLAIWIVSGGLLVQVHRQAASPQHRAMALGLGAGLIAHFVFSMTDAIPLGAKVGVVFWLTVAMVAALHHVALDSRLRRLEEPEMEGGP